MQSASAAHVEAQSALLVGAAFGSKSLWPIVMKRPSEGPSALWPHPKVPSTQLRQAPKFSSKTVEAGGGSGGGEGGGGEGGGGAGGGLTLQQLSQVCGQTRGQGGRQLEPTTGALPHV